MECHAAVKDDKLSLQEQFDKFGVCLAFACILFIFANL
jgi:hypothetical protein